MSHPVYIKLPGFGCKKLEISGCKVFLRFESCQGSIVNARRYLLWSWFWRVTIHFSLSFYYITQERTKLSKYSEIKVSKFDKFQKILHWWLQIEMFQRSSRNGDIKYYTITEKISCESTICLRSLICSMDNVTYRLISQVEDLEQGCKVWDYINQTITRRKKNTSFLRYMNRF